MNKLPNSDTAKSGHLLAASDKKCFVNYEPVGQVPSEEGRNLHLPAVAWRGQTGIVDRFWSKVEKTSTCWLWRGLILSHGYGQITLGHPSTPGSKRWRAHRFSWELHVGPVPDGLVVCHKCDVPACVNPAHLFVGTQQDNHLDAVRKGRKRAWGLQKLDADDVRVIRAQARRGILRKDIALAFSIAPNTVSGIVHRKSWKHLAAEDAPVSSSTASPLTVDRRNREC